MDNVIKATEPKSYFKYRTVGVSDNRRPIYGVLTEPLRGDMKAKDDSSTFEASAEEISYIPKAHVQFLEQSGVIVVPISYLDSDADIKRMLKEVNGIYVPGDSHKAIANKRYQQAFTTIMDFVQKANKVDKDYFPMFLMGKSAQTLISQMGLSSAVLHNMKSWRNANSKLNVLKKAEDTFLLHQLQFDASNAHAFDMGSFFNRQQTGFRVQDILMDDAIKKWLSPVSTFAGSAYAEHELTMDNIADKAYDPNNEFVAIAEGIDLPLYIFTYNIEMTQFVYTDLLVNPEQEEVIDKSIPARHHAQFISH